MSMAVYFSTHDLDESEYLHYALNVPYYTHFTSPIRRYPDIVVHRLVSAALLKKKESPMAGKKLSNICVDCNLSKLNARKAQDQSDYVFLTLWLQHNPIRDNCFVISICKSSFDVLSPHLGIDERVSLERTGCSSSSFNKEEHTLKLTWNNDPSTMVTLQLLSRVTVEFGMNPDRCPIEIRAKLVPAHLQSADTNVCSAEQKISHVISDVVDDG